MARLHVHGAEVDRGGNVEFKQRACTAGKLGDVRLSAGHGGAGVLDTYRTTSGGLDAYNQGQGLNTSATTAGLPMNDSPLYVPLFTGANGRGSGTSIHTRQLATSLRECSWSVFCCGMTR